MKHASILSMLMLLVATGSLAAPRCYYVANDGTDGSKGTEEAPFKTIKYAATRAQAGDTVLIKGGTYTENEIRPNSGSAGKMITFKPSSRRDSVFLYNEADSASTKAKPSYRELSTKKSLV